MGKSSKGKSKGGKPKELTDDELLDQAIAENLRTEEERQQQQQQLRATAEQQQQNKSARTSATSSPRKENDGRADPSPARVRKEPAGTERPIPLSPTGAKATAPEQPPEAAAASSQPAASGADAPRPYWPTAKPHGDSHNSLHARLPNGVRPHDWLEAPTVQPPASLPRGNRTVAFFLHYPRETPYNSYGTPTGDGTDATVCMMARALNKALPSGDKVAFLGQFDYGDDLDGPRPLKVGSDDYSFHKHCWKKWSRPQQKQWWASKVRKLASVMVDEIVERDREGMDAVVAGDCPREFWPELLAAAAAIARKETGRPYDIAYPPDLPPLQPLEEGEAAPEVGAYELQHPSGAAPGRFMSLCHRKRLDAAFSWAQRVKLNGAEITYFQSLSSKYGDKSEAEIKELRRDASARYGGYHGPWPSESELTTEQWAAQHPEQWAALNAALSKAGKMALLGGAEAWAAIPAAKRTAALSNAATVAMLGGAEASAAIPAAERPAAMSNAASLSKRGGAELVAKAAAGDKAAEAESRRKASAGLVRDGSHNKGKRGGVRARVSEEGEVRKTKRMKALTPEATEEAACAHFSKLGLSTENPLARCSGCSCWNLLFPVFADDLSRAPGPGRKHNKTGNESCGRYEALVAA